MVFVYYIIYGSRIPCDYQKQKNLGIRVEESSRKPHYLAIKFLYQGGQTEIVAVDVAQVPCLRNFSYFTSCNLIILFYFTHPSC